MRLTESEDYDIRFTEVSDLNYLRSWLKSDHMLHWYPPSDEMELENFARIWIGFSRYNAALTATFKQKPIAQGTLFLMPYRKVSHHAMLQVIVDREYQQKGVGYSLLRNLKHLAKEQFRLEFLHAEVLDISPILSLLNKLDFTEFARQEKYVKEKGEYYPRILMGCALS